MSNTLLTAEVEAIPEPATRSRKLRNGVIIGDATLANGGITAVGISNNASRETASMFTQAGVIAEMFGAGDLLVGCDKWDEKSDAAANVGTGALDNLTEWREGDSQ